jgi:hypothetical protein
MGVANYEGRCFSVAVRHETPLAKQSYGGRFAILSHGSAKSWIFSNKNIQRIRRSVPDSN